MVDAHEERAIKPMLGPDPVRMKITGPDSRDFLRNARTGQSREAEMKWPLLSRDDEERACP